MSSDPTPADTPGASAAEDAADQYPSAAGQELGQAEGQGMGQGAGRHGAGAAPAMAQTPGFVESDMPHLSELPQRTRETPGPEAQPTPTAHDVGPRPVDTLQTEARTAEPQVAEPQAAEATPIETLADAAEPPPPAEGQSQFEAVAPLGDAVTPALQARQASATPPSSQDGAWAGERVAAVDTPESGAYALASQAGAAHEAQPTIAADATGAHLALAGDEVAGDVAAETEAHRDEAPARPEPAAVRALTAPLAPDPPHAASEPVAAQGARTSPLAPGDEIEAPAGDGTDRPAHAEQPTRVEMPTYVEPPIWSKQPTYAEPASPPLRQWPTVWVDPHNAATRAPIDAPPEYGRPDYAGPDYAGPDYAGPDYAGPDYAGPIEYPQTPAYPATVYPTTISAPPPNFRRQRRWPLILLTVAALAIVVALSLALAATAFKAFGRSGSVTTLYANPMTTATKVWPSDQECAFKGDGYHITSATNCYYSGADYQDVTVSVTVTLLKGDGAGAYGIAFRRPSPNKYYVFLITGNGAWLVAKGNVSLAAAQRNSAIKTGLGAVNTLAVQMQGSHFTFFANGAQLGEVTDSAYTRGYVGLAGDSNVEVAFRDFTVTQP